MGAESCKTAFFGPAFLSQKRRFREAVMRASTGAIDPGRAAKSAVRNARPKGRRRMPPRPRLFTGAESPALPQSPSSHDRVRHLHTSMLRALRCSAQRNTAPLTELQRPRYCALHHPSTASFSCADRRPEASATQREQPSRSAPRPPNSRTVRPPKHKKAPADAEAFLKSRRPGLQRERGPGPAGAVSLLSWGMTWGCSAMARARVRSATREKSSPSS